METDAIEHVEQAQSTEAPIIASIKRKRGRPSKPCASIQDPASSTIQEVNKRRRGRPPKKAKVDCAEAVEAAASPETSGGSPSHVAANKDDVAEPPAEAPAASTSPANTARSANANRRSRSTPQRMTEADEPLASTASTPAACPPGASPQHAVQSPPSRRTPASSTGSRGTTAAHDASEPSSPPSKPLSSSASQSDPTATGSVTTAAAASTPSSSVSSVNKTKRWRSTTAHAVGGNAGEGQGRHSRPSTTQKSAKQQKAISDTPTEATEQLDRRAVKRVRKDQFKEENIEAYCDTVTVFCLRDFLGNKRWSKEVLELSQRSRRLLHRRDAGGDGKPQQKRHARASRLRDTLHRLLQEVEM